MRCHRTGFTIVEITVVCVLSVVLAVIVSSAWTGMGRAAADLIGRSQLVQERDVAVAALSRDLGGCLLDPLARTGDKTKGRWLSWTCPTNATLTTNQDLLLTFNTGTTAAGIPLPNTTIRYLAIADPDPNSSTLLLVRRMNDDAPTQFTVAKNVHSMFVTINPTDNSARITICFEYRKFTLTCDLTAREPSVASATILPWQLDHY
jgi:type II secretory pathway pseudopilin PulG